MNLAAFVQNWWWTFVLGAVGAFLTAIWTMFRKRIKKEITEQQAIKAAVLAILHDRLRQGCMHQLKIGQTTPSDMDNLRKMYEGYHGLGGNGTVQKLYERCTELPLNHDKTI